MESQSCKECENEAEFRCEQGYICIDHINSYLNSQHQVYPLFIKFRQKDFSETLKEILRLLREAKWRTIKKIQEQMTESVQQISQQTEKFTLFVEKQFSQTISRIQKYLINERIEIESPQYRLIQQNPELSTAIENMYFPVQFPKFQNNWTDYYLSLQTSMLAAQGQSAFKLAICQDFMEKINKKHNIKQENLLKVLQENKALQQNIQQLQKRQQQYKNQIKRLSQQRDNLKLALSKFQNEQRQQLIQHHPLPTHNLPIQLPTLPLLNSFTVQLNPSQIRFNLQKRHNSFRFPHCFDSSRCLHTSNSTIILTGGGKRQQDNFRSFIVNLKTLSVTDLPNLIFPRCYHAMSFIDTLPAVLGGTQGPKARGECQTLLQGQWAIVPSMNIPRSSFSAVSQGNTTYVFGGQTGKNRHTMTIEKYCNGVWKVLGQQLKTSFRSVGSVDMGGKIMLLGGYSDRNLNEVYEFRQEVLIQASPMMQNARFPYNSWMIEGNCLISYFFNENSRKLELMTYRF